MARRASHLFVAAGLAALTLAACRTVLGIEPLPSETMPDDESPGARRDASTNDARRPDADAIEGPFDPAWAHWSIPDDANLTTFEVKTGITHDFVTNLDWQSGSEAPAAWADAKAACENLTLDGRRGFRLPTRIELLSIMDFGLTRTGIPFTDAFLNEDWQCYWTISNSSDGSSHWLLAAYDSMIVRSSKDETRCLARCVQGQPYDFENGKNPPPYEIANVYVRDPWTSLEWQASSAESGGKRRSLAEADAYCRELLLDGRDDWRLPTIKELATLIDERRLNPALDPLVVGEMDVYWSSTAHPAWREDGADENLAWRLAFSDGTMFLGDDGDGPFPAGVARTRCVRKYK